jgi:hypothetical protein
MRWPSHELLRRRSDPQSARGAAAPDCREMALNKHQPRGSVAAMTACRGRSHSTARSGLFASKRAPMARDALESRRAAAAAWRIGRRCGSSPNLDFGHLPRPLRSCSAALHPRAAAVQRANAQGTRPAGGRQASAVRRLGATNAATPDVRRHGTGHCARACRCTPTLHGRSLEPLSRRAPEALCRCVPPRGLCRCGRDWRRAARLSAAAGAAAQAQAWRARVARTGAGAAV